MDKGIDLWNKILTAAMQTPGVKVNRNEFLRKSFKAHYTDEQITQFLENGTIGTVPVSILDELATDCINRHTRIVTTTSFVCGIPGGFALLGTIPSDLIQYYFHVFVLSQKVAYLYGYPDLCDDEGHFTDDAKEILTVFVGVMGGVTAANKVVQEIAEQVQKALLKRMPTYVLTKTFLYPLVKQVAKWIGINLTKQSFARGLGKVVPIIGGFVSGLLTYITFKPQSKKLKRQLRDQMLQAYEQVNELKIES